MEQKKKAINKDFNMPFYIVEELVEYAKKEAIGQCATINKENLQGLLKLAVINERLTEEQAKVIIKEFCNE